MVSGLADSSERRSVWEESDVRLSMNEVVIRLKEFIENEMWSCSMDIYGIIPMYVYRMLGRSVAIGEIANAMEDVRRMM